MKILLDTTPLTNGHQGRGIGTYTRELLGGLRALKPKEGALVVQATHELGGKIESTEHFDLIHYPYFDLFFATLPQRKKTPLVVTIHDVIPLVFPQQYRPGIKGTLRFHQQKWRLQSVDAIITDSECSKKDITRYLGVAANKIFVTPLAASASLQPVSEYLAEKYTAQLNLPEKFILYIGDINYNKNLPTLLLALTQLPEDIHLCVVSRTFTNTAIPEGKQLAHMIAANDLQHRVHILDIPPGENELMSAVLTQARCLVQPSLYEGFGLPVLEAMQVGTPVVAARTSSLPEVGGDAPLWVEPTISGLSGGLLQAVKLRGEDRQERKEAGWRQARQFSWQKTAQLTYEAYTHVVG